MMNRFFGSALLTYAAVLWLARESGDSPARRAIVLGFFLTMIVGAVVALHTQLTTTTNALGWTTVALYALLALCYAYFQFSGQQSVLGTQWVLAAAGGWLLIAALTRRSCLGQASPCRGDPPLHACVGCGAKR